jgi:hypothetical protein
MTVARLRYRRISNHLQFGGVTSLTMAMAARRKSSRILDGGNTAMSAHRLLDKDGVQRFGELFDSTLFVGRYLGRGLLVVALAAGESSKIWFRN